MFTKNWFKKRRWAWARPSSATSTPPKAICLLCKKEIAVKKSTFIKHARTLLHMALGKAGSKKNLKPSKLQVEVKQPKSKEGKPTGKKRNSKKTTQETLMSTNESEILDLEVPSSQLNMKSVRISTHSSHNDNLQKEEEENILQKSEPDSVNFISAINRSQVSNFGKEIEERIKRLSKEIEILQHSVIEKAELCETTGNIRYVIESNTFRRITKEKIQELANAKDLLRSIVTNTN